MIASYLNCSFSKALFLFFLFLLLTFNCLAQKKQPYTLLWEISGKGLTKPSYLFGYTIVKDDRSFNFSDSVFKTLTASTAFVLENHPDSLGDNRFQLHNKSEANTGGIVQRYTLNTIDPKQTFALAYLYGIARSHNKKILGLLPTVKSDARDTTEDENPPNMAEEDQDEQFDEIESVLSAYKDGNLDEIWKKIKIYYEEDDGAETKEIFNQLNKLLASEQVFAAFNFPALAGDKGLIALFKNTGYTVRPVEASFTAIGQSYNVDYTQMARYSYQDEQYNYSISFPSVPNTIVNKSKIKNYHDPINGIIYTSSSLYTGPLNGYTSAQYADSALVNYIKQSKLELVKKTSLNKFGTTVLEVVLKGDKKFAKSWLLHINGTFYSLTAEHETDILNATYIDQFFNSLQITSPKAITSNNWIDYKHKAGAFSIKIPIQPQETTQNVINEDKSSSYKLNLYMSTDKTNLINYLIRYNDFPTGTYLENKRIIFDGMLADFTQKGQIIGQPKVIEKDGYEGRSYEMISNGSYIEVRLFIRGNRIYLLLKQNMNGTSKPKADQFFSSFKFDPYISAEKVSFNIGNATFIVPSQPRIEKTEKDKDETEDDKHSSFLSGEVVYNALNTNSGASYVVAKSTMSKYFRSKNLDSLTQALIEKLKPQNNTANATTTDFKLGTIKGKEMVYLDTLSGNIRKTRIWFNQGLFYYQFLISGKEEIESDAANDFFNKTEIKEQATTFDVTSSKAKLITEDLLNKDPETYKAALGALSYYAFDHDELPTIYTALTHKYTDDTTNTGARISLLEFLNNVNDKQTPDFLKKLYQDNKGADLIQSNILSMLPKIDSTSYDWYLKQLEEAPTFKLKNYWFLFSPLKDSLSYTAKHIDQVLKLMEIKEYRPTVLGIISEMISEKNDLYHTLIESKKEFISRNISSDLDNDIVVIKLGEYPTTMYSYLNILPALKLPQLTDNYTNKVIALDSIPYLRTQAFVARIVTGLDLDQQMLNAQLDSLSSRYDILYAFNKVGKLTSVPLKYRKHDEFTKLLLYNYLDEEYAIPEEIKLLGDIKEAEKTYYVFEFSYTEDGIKKVHVGVGGHSNTKTDTLDFGSYSTYSTFDPKEKDWLKQAKNMVKELKKIK